MLAYPLLTSELDEDGADGDWITVGPMMSIPHQGATIVAARSGERIAVFRDGLRIGAVSNLCAHQNGPIGEGRIIDGCITCPWHGFQYRLEDGCAPPPFTEKLVTFATGRLFHDEPGVIALVLSYSAYVSEVYRAGLNSVHRSQVAAARSLGLSQPAALRYVILPQAVRNIVPPLLNDFISLQKDTALVGVLGAIEANNAAQIYGSTVFNYSSFTVAAILFLLLTIPLARVTDHLIERDRRRRLAGAVT